MCAKVKIDVHSHIFNCDYIFQELFQILWDFMRQDYPLKDQGSKFPGETVGSLLVSLMQVAKYWLLEPELRAASRFLMQDYKNYCQDISSSIGEGVVVPLMMDIYYMFAPVDWEKQNTSDSSVPVEEMKNKSETRMSWGYSSHFEDLKSMKNELVFPFLAVDPRRPGIMELVRNNVSKTGPFYGIKLYPRLGYYPSNPLLFNELYPFCQDKEIPITVHCSTGGFPPENFLLPKPCPELCDPKEWLPILEKYKKLRVNFAHFGAGDKKWTETIVGLMRPYRYVYTDISCYTEKKDFDYIKEIIKSYPFVEERLMYGTDYTMTLLFNCTPQEFYKNVSTLEFLKNIFEKITVTNPAEFLDIPHINNTIINIKGVLS